MYIFLKSEQCSDLGGWVGYGKLAVEISRKIQFAVYVWPCWHVTIFWTLPKLSPEKKPTKLKKS